jgi:hypothetical protein
MKKEKCILYSGGIKGAEAEFGANAERCGIEEVNFTFEGHGIVRQRGVRVMGCDELKKGDVSLEYVSKLMNRRFTKNESVRKVLQSIWHQVNNGQEIYVVGHILGDGTVKGGTGWGAELAKLCNKPLFVFDQDRDCWFKWDQMDWVECETPVITHPHFTGTGTRFLEDNGRAAIAELFNRSFNS